jgi:hypothetical protein
MKSVIQNLAFGALLGASGSVTAAPVLFPNGDFASGDAFWQEVGPAAFDYPASGGNPGGFGVIDATAAVWGIWVGNADAAIPLDELGLTAGQTYVFFQDMKILSGDNVGGLKLDFVPSGSTGDINLPRIGDGTAWARYAYPIAIPAGATGIKVVPLWGRNSRVAYDNLGVETTPFVPPVLSPDLVHEDGFAADAAHWGAPVGGAGLSPSVRWSASEGNPGGSTVLAAANPAGAPAAVTFTYTAEDIDFGEGPVEISFDGKLLDLRPGTAIHVRYNGNFVGAVMNEMNADAYTTVRRSFTLSQGFAATSTVTLSFEFALGAVVNSGGSLAIDNVRVKTKLAGETAPPDLAIRSGTLVGWSPGASSSAHQPQESMDNSVWVDLGPVIPNNTVTSVFDPSRAGFYRVQAISPDVFDNAVSNPGFETSDVSADPADDWQVPVQPNPGASMTVGDSYAAIGPHGGSKMLILESTGPGAPAPNVEVRSHPFPVTGGEEYTLSFWVAHPVKTGSANPQYSVFYFNESGGLIGNSFTPGFGAIGSAWTRFSAPVTPPADAVTMTVGWIQAASAEANVHWVTLIDDVSLSQGLLIEAGATTTLAATATAAVELSWPGVVGRTYQAEGSGNLLDWSDFGGPAAGRGSVFSLTDPVTPANRFYRVRDITP